MAADTVSTFVGTPAYRDLAEPHALLQADRPALFACRTVSLYRITAIEQSQ